MNQQLINTLFILLITLCVLLGLFLYFRNKKNQGAARRADDERNYSVTALIEHIKTCINDITRTNLYELGLNEIEFKKQANKRAELKKALKSCMHGSIEDKQFVKAFIYDILCTYIPTDKLNQVIPFHNPRILTPRDKFAIILYAYKKKYDYDALTRLIDEHNLDGEKAMKGNDVSLAYSISVEEILTIYEKESILLKPEDKLEIITQYVYEKYKGLGVIDEIRDMNVDGVSGGVSGVTDEILYSVSNTQNLKNSLDLGQKQPRNYDSVWIFFRGKSIRLEALSFESEKELRRVCQNIYRYNRGGQLSELTGYRVNEMKDGSRVLVVRPPFSESWAFFVRKFHIKNVTLETLFKEESATVAIDLVKYLAKGAMITAVTGQQGSGKTTLLMAMIRHIYATHTLRIQEMAFELHLRKLYPYRNILTFRETETISGQQGLDIQKKTDGSVNILGEVATDPVAAWMIQMAQVASLFTLFTHHAKTTKDLIYSLRNSLLKCEMFSNERVAEQQVVSVLNFDIHLNRDFKGNRYIERITEIVESSIQEPYAVDYRADKPLEQNTVHFYETASEYFYRVTDRIPFETRNIIEYQDGRYVAVHPISQEKVARMQSAMTPEDRVEFDQYLKAHWG